MDVYEKLAKKASENKEMSNGNELDDKLKMFSAKTGYLPTTEPNAIDSVNSTIYNTLRLKPESSLKKELLKGLESLEKTLPKTPFKTLTPEEIDAIDALENPRFRKLVFGF